MTLQGIKQRFGIVGNSAALERALSTAMRVAATDLTVLITGESGVGKENIANIIHSLSKRKHSTFIAINCGAIPGGTINSELFGHEKGSFTGATSDRKGYFETADTGTIFLDEVGELPLDTQAYLLRILESGDFIRVGSSTVKKTDVRVVAATNKDLLERIKKGKFREDLYYRLNTVPIPVPALRDRTDDILMLFRRFALDFSEKYRSETIRLDDQGKKLIENYGWPGNIRELKNVVEQLSVLSDKSEISASDIVDLIPTILKRNLPALHTSPSLGDGSGFEERELLYQVLFDMKKDLNDLKSLVFELIRSNDLEMPDASRWKKPLTESSLLKDDVKDWKRPGQRESFGSDQEDINPDIYITHPNEDLGNAEILEDTLSLVDMEKSMIGKALKKYNGRRKEAAAELGISERTLYRKISEYELS